MNEKSSVNHFEIPYEDLDRAVAFYKDVFAWETQSLPEINYTLAYSVDINKKQVPKSPGAINGGFVEKSEKQPYPTLVLTVNSIDETLSTIKEKGGSVIQEKEEVPQMGLFALIKDSEENTIGLWENLPKPEEDKQEKAEKKKKKKKKSKPKTKKKGSKKKASKKEK
ncbi:MAG: VOC family protein [Candidatus Hodarchaeales archaeon]